MSKYSRFRYSQATYGAAPSTIGYSVAPLNAFVFDYTKEEGKIELSWVQPTGDFTQMRIVRNQDAFPETSEDGVIVYDALSPISDLYTYDTNTSTSYPSFVPGRYAYYRAWLRKTDNLWYPAGDAYVLVPTSHPTKTSRDTVRTASDGAILQNLNVSSNNELLSTHDKLVDLLPRVFTSTAESPLDAVNSDSVIYRFLGAFAATLDESLTFADLLKPQKSGRSANPTTLGLAANMYGLLPEPFLATKSQKKMIGEARYIYSRKGTVDSLGVMIESLTGYAPTIEITSNAMTSIQDSSFYKGAGFWTASGSTTIEAFETDTSVAYNVPTTESRAIDLAWVGKVVVNTANDYVANGTGSVFTRGIAVEPDLEYVFSYYVKGTGTVTSQITWYDNLGVVIGSPVNGDGITGSSTAWTKDDSLVTTSPSNAAYASVKITFGSTGTKYLDMVQFSSSAVLFYEEPKAAIITVAGNKTNHIKNPSFESWTSTTLNDWTTNGTTSKENTTLSPSYGGTYMLELTTNAGATSLSTTADTTYAENNSFYTFSAYMQAPAGNETFTITLTADDGTNDPFSFTTAPFTVTSTWTRFHGTFKVPANFSSTTLVIDVEISGTTTGNVVNIDNAQLESSYNPSDYFDGSFGFANGAFWGGTENGSASYLYVNRISKIPRLIAELPNYLPMNTPYLLYTYYGLEYKTVV